MNKRKSKKSKCTRCRNASEHLEMLEEHGYLAMLCRDCYEKKIIDYYTPDKPNF